MMVMTYTVKQNFWLFFPLIFFLSWVVTPSLQAMGSNKSLPPPVVPFNNLSPSTPPKLQVTLPAGTPIKVQLNQSIRTSTGRKGQTFFATLKEPVGFGKQTIFPAGIPLIGVITRSEESGHFSGTALIELQLVKLILSNEQILPMDTKPFQKKGQVHFLRNIGLIGGGAIIGAGSGNLLGQIPGALIGIFIGAGTGAIMAYITGKEDIFIKAGTEVIFKLSRPMAFFLPSDQSVPSTAFGKFERP
jgi:uncharacterized membrane protein